MTNSCVYDCKYCVNRRSNDVRRTAFTPRELAELTIQFYRRNYIEGQMCIRDSVRIIPSRDRFLVRAPRIQRAVHELNEFQRASKPLGLFLVEPLDTALPGGVLTCLLYTSRCV